MTSTVFVIFGATGDLSRRKLIPAIKRLYERGELGEDFFVLGTAADDLRDETFRELVEESLQTFGGEDSATDECLLSRFLYNQMEFTEQQGYGFLKHRLQEISCADTQFIYYLALPPQLFPTVLSYLVAADIYERGNPEHKIAFEKPFGHDLASAQSLNRQLKTYATEEQIYRIDHYLGKDAIQDLLVLRFANVLFEPIWNRHHIDNVQITAFETAGVGHRAGYYDQAGALRDMVQNHLLQMLALIAMEPPADLHADTIRDEKVKVFHAIKSPLEEPDHQTVFGQYERGVINGTVVSGYCQEHDIPDDSLTETFAALRLQVDNWRWSGVPFYLRTGKRMDRDETTIVIEFKQVPRLLYNLDCGMDTNKLIIHVQPDEHIQVQFNVKQPDFDTRVAPIYADFDHKHYFGLNTPEAYEVLLREIMRGDQTLFTRSDGVEASWRIINRLMKCREACTMRHGYPGGSRGPQAADDLLKKEQRQWHNL